VLSILSLQFLQFSVQHLNISECYRDGIFWAIPHSSKRREKKRKKTTTKYVGRLLESIEFARRRKRRLCTSCSIDRRSDLIRCVCGPWCLFGNTMQHFSSSCYSLFQFPSIRSLQLLFSVTSCLIIILLVIYNQLIIIDYLLWSYYYLLLIIIYFYFIFLKFRLDVSFFLILWRYLNWWSYLF